MKETFVRSHINGEIGFEYQGYTLEEWAYIKNIPNYLLVKKIKTEEDLARKKANKDKKRREKRQKEKE